MAQWVETPLARSNDLSLIFFVRMAPTGSFAGILCPTLVELFGKHWEVVIYPVGVRNQIWKSRVQSVLLTTKPFLHP